MSTSGSFVRGDETGRMPLSYSFYNDRQQLQSGSIVGSNYVYDKQELQSGSLAMVSMKLDDEAEPRSSGFLQGLAFGSPTTIDGNGSFGRHMQVGVNEEFGDGTPT